MPEIRLNKKNKTIKIVNRRQNLRLQHTGKTGPQGPRGVAGGYFIPYTLRVAGDEAPAHGEFSLAYPQNLVFSLFADGEAGVDAYFVALANAGTLEIFVRNNPDEWSIIDYVKKNWTNGGVYSTTDLVNSGSDVYRALQNHTAASTSQPSVGVDWADYWVLFAEDAMTVAYTQLATSYSFQGGEKVGIAFNPEGPQGPQGDTGVSTFVRVHHGANANVPRPVAVYVEWVGSVAPLNATIEDTWIQTP